MERSAIKQFSNEVTARYGRMISEMVRRETQESIMPRMRADNSFFYLRIVRLPRRWITDEAPIWVMMQELFIGLYAMGVSVSVLFCGDGKSLSVYIGTAAEYIEVLMGMLQGIFPQLGYSLSEGGNARIFSYADAAGSSLDIGGFLKGNPSGGENFQNLAQIDSVIKGMAGRSWIVSLFALPTDKRGTLMRQQQWLSFATRCSALSQVTFSDTDNLESMSYKQNYYESEQYIKKLEAFCERSMQSVSIGEWCVTINYAASTEPDARLLAGLLTAAFYGDHSEPEAVHTIARSERIAAPLVNGEEYVHDVFMGSELPFPRYSTYLSSQELAIYAAFPTVDTGGIAVVDQVAFDVHREIGGDLVIGNILDSGRVTENLYSLDSNEFNRHCLVVGLTGAGKTNTVKSLICHLTAGAKRPVMVIEPAKKEYWELYKLGFNDLQIYSVGSNEPGTHTFCLNPFERAVYTDQNGTRRAVPIQTHIDFVYSAFKASFIMYTPMPYVLERAIYEIYEDCGWDIHGNINTRGREIYPTIEDLYFKIPQVVTDMGYDKKMRNDLIGSLQARVNSMRLGTKGDTLNVERSFPLDRLLKGNVVVELEDIGDDDVKAFIISLLLVNLLEIRRQQEDCQLEVRHLMLIEEAHRLLKNVQSGSGENADPRGAAVEFFCNLLAELRSKGQGFIVADQIPSKLAPDLIKNTNLKIVHRTVAEEERTLIGGAMHMTPEQIDSLSSLKQGVAAVYSEGDERPKLVRSKYAGSFAVPERNRMTREQVLSAVAPNCFESRGRREYTSLTDAKSEICRRCDAHCEKSYKDILGRLKDPGSFDALAENMDPNRTKSCRADKIDEAIRTLLKNQFTGTKGEIDKSCLCLLNCFLERWKLNKSVENKLIDRYMS